MTAQLERPATATVADSEMELLRVPSATVPIQSQRGPWIWIPLGGRVEHRRRRSAPPYSLRAPAAAAVRAKEEDGEWYC